MEVDQLKTFVAVVTFGGFRRAAEVLFLSQPAVSARIKALERSLGVPLFERRREGLVLSVAGRALREHAEHLLHEVAVAQQAVHEASGARSGVLSIAAALSICTYLLPDALKRFQAEYPKVAITVRSGHSKNVLEMVLRGEAEIGLARSLHHPQVETVSLGDDPLILVAHRAHAPVKSRKAPLAEVADWPLIFFDRGSSDWTLSHGLFRMAGLVPNVALEVETIEAAKRMVERGLGLAFLPQLAVTRDIRSRRLVAIEVTNAAPLSRSLDVIHSRHRPQSAEAVSFLRTLQATVGEMAGAGGRPPRRRRGGTAQRHPALSDRV
jgi:DNA-binding transcriptional LysR family regulator